MSRGVPGIVHGMRSLFLQDEFGQVLEATSISAGLDYPGVGPEHAMLAAQGRAEYVSATDEEALEGFQLLAATVHHTKEIKEDVLLADYTADGRLVGIEILSPVRISDLLKLVHQEKAKPSFRKFLKNSAPRDLVTA